MRSLVVLFTIAMSSACVADSRAAFSFKILSNAAEWVAVGQIVDVSRVECVEPFGPVLLFTFHVDDAWKGTINNYVKFGVLERPWLEDIRLGGRQNFKPGQRAVVAYDPRAVSCPYVADTRGLLPIDELGVDTSTIPGEPRSQSIDVLRDKFKRALLN